MAEDFRGPAEEAVVVAALTRVIERHAAYSLIASDGLSERLFYFAIGGIRVIRSGPRKTQTIGDLLVESGKLSRADVERATAAAEREGRTFGEACAALKLASREDVAEASVTKVREDLLELFMWDEAEIRLMEGQPAKEFYEGRFEAARIGCDVTEFLQSVFARVNEWKGAVGRVPSVREVYETTAAGRTPRAEAWKNALLALLDGTRTASEAISSTDVRRVVAYEFLLESLRAGAIRRVAGGQAQRVSREQLVREIEALEAALKVTADAAIVRRRLARALEAADEKSRAAAQWRLVGDERRRANDLDGALECYRHAVAASPTDIATREQLLDIHRHRRDYARLVSDGRPLAEVFVKHNLLNRAKNLLLALVRIAPDDAALRRQLVFVLVGLGERDQALKTLREVARLLEKSQAPNAELRDVYVRILAMDKNDESARDRLDALTGAKLTRRVLRTTLASAAVVVVALAGWFWYEGSARRVLNRAITSAQERIEANDVAGAKTVLEEAVAAYSHARATSAAQLMIDRIELYEQTERARLDAIAERGVTPAQRAQAAAEQLVRRAKELASVGRAEDAHRAYRELFDLYGSTPAAETVALPLKVTVLPLDADVVLAGERLGRGSVVLNYSPRAKCTLVVQHEGYAPFKRVLDGPQEASLEVALERPTRWTFAADASIDAPVLVCGGVVYVAGRDRRLTALSAADGSPQWRAPLGLYGDVAAAPVMTSEGVFVATEGGDAACVSAATGDVLWTKRLAVGVDRQLASLGAEAVVVAGDDGSLTALGAAGAALWTLGAGAAASPAVPVDDKLFAYLDDKGRLALAETTTGFTVADAPPPMALRGVPAVQGGRAWAMADDQSLRLISTATRRAVRRFAVPAATEFAPTVAGERAYVVCVDGGVHAFRASGDQMFRAKIDEAPSAAAAYSKGRLYVPGQKGRLYVFDAEKGALIWRFDAKSRITATPTIVDGTIYVPTAAGTLAAVEE